MKKTLLLGCCLAVGAMANAQNVTGPSSSRAPYLEGTPTGVKFVSIITAGDVVNGYVCAGIPDGAGGWDNGDGTFTMLVNHEIPNTSAGIRAHGNNGAFVSKWIVNKSDWKVVSGSDLMQRVQLWNGTNFTLYSPTNVAATSSFSRFCSGDVPAVSALYNSVTGKGTKERIMMNGEESGVEGRPFAHIATGPNAGTSWELTFLAKMAFENVIASPFEQDKTIVALTDDGTGGQVYFYIGDKKTTGNEIEKAGLTGGKVYGLAVTGLLIEVNASVPAAGTPFTLVDLGQTPGVSGATLNTNSVTGGVTTFLRPEDGLWDPKNPNDFYFVTTNGFGSPTRMWRARFTDIKNPENGGTITAVLDGTEPMGQQMYDNIGIDNFGHIIIQEDPGGNDYNARQWQYDIATDAIKELSKHDATRFVPGGANFLTNNEEASGIFDAQEILGAGWFLLVDQAHHSVAGQVYEGGQILAMYNPDSYNSNPEITVLGNSVEIKSGDIMPTGNDNTDFGNIATGSNVTKTFTIKNDGMASLKVDSIKINGVNASEFTIDGNPTFPMNIAAAGTQTFTVKFAPTNVGLRTATVNVWSNDFNEGSYNYAVQGVGLNPKDVENTTLSKFVKLYPNPTSNAATVAIHMAKEQKVAISVVDMNGRIAAPAIEQHLAAGEQKISVSTANLANGNYFVVITTGEEITKIQLVVAH